MVRIEKEEEEKKRSHKLLKHDKFIINLYTLYGVLGT